MQIAFPPDPPEYCGRDLVVAFSALVDGRCVQCAVTAEALEDHFGARSLLERDLLDAFDAHRPAIETMARRMLDEIGGRPVLLHSGHFRLDD
ncbi:periplasmic protein [Burkholderia anthina]|nr:periplasmic protein [Burkholderia anthina]